MLTKYGYNTILVSAVISVLFVVVSFFISNTYGKVGLLLLAILLIVFTLNFFRDPERKTPAEEKIVVSPADGKVLLIKDVFDNRFLNSEAKQVSIFMSPLNVHVNRIPISGKVEYLKYVEGEFLTAFNDKADELNERSEIGISNEHGKILFTQVAGMVARRIVYELNVGNSVEIGKRFGMIKFGSRVDVIVPRDWELKVKEGDITSAGETILFKIN